MVAGKFLFPRLQTLHYRIQTISNDESLNCLRSILISKLINQISMSHSCKNPANIYLLKVAIEALKKEMKYVQS